MLSSPLKKNGEHYEMDFAQMESMVDEHTKMMILCNPHNPTGRAWTKEELVQALLEYKGVPQELGLPSAPKQFIQYMTEDDRPQVKLDVNFEKGMGVSIGRLRKDKVYDWKFIGLSHNTARGAAGGAIECAELLKAQGYITKK